MSVKITLVGDIPECASRIKHGKPFRFHFFFFFPLKAIIMNYIRYCAIEPSPVFHLYILAEGIVCDKIWLFESIRLLIVYINSLLKLAQVRNLWFSLHSLLNLKPTFIFVHHPRSHHLKSITPRFKLVCICTRQHLVYPSFTLFIAIEIPEIECFQLSFFKFLQFHHSKYV